MLSKPRLCSSICGCICVFLKPAQWLSIGLNHCIWSYNWLHKSTNQQFSPWQIKHGLTSSLCGLWTLTVNCKSSKNQGRFEKEQNNCTAQKKKSNIPKENNSVGENDGLHSVDPIITLFLKYTEPSVKPWDGNQICVQQRLHSDWDVFFSELFSK